MQPFRMDKTAFTVADLHQESDEVEYWRTKTPAERLQALEFMREAMYGHDDTRARLQRVLTVAQLGED